MPNKKGKMVTSIERQIDIATAKQPEIPSDFAKRWSTLERKIWADYLSGRAWADWQDSDIRLLAKCVDLEILVLEAHDAIRKDGPFYMTQAGNMMSHPANAAINRTTATQLSILRRLGISTSGVDTPAMVANAAKKGAELQTKPRSNQLLA